MTSNLAHNLALKMDQLANECNLLDPTIFGKPTKLFNSLNLDPAVLQEMVTTWGKIRDLAKIGKIDEALTILVTAPFQKALPSHKI